MLRPDINRVRGADFGEIRMSPLSDGAYVLSDWTMPWTGMEIAKVDADGQVVWRLRVPETSGTPKYCGDPALATLPNGDALVACTLDGQIRTYDFDRMTGAYDEAAFLLPDCNDGKHPVALSLFARPDGQILVSGTRPPSNSAASCSWLARLPIAGP